MSSVVTAAGCQNKIPEEKTENVNDTLKVTPFMVNKDTSDLDILQNYNKDLWAGPAAWTEEQWQWKRTLKWDRQCDYLGDVTTVSTSLGYDIIQIICVTGAYQPTQYLFTFDPESKKYQQLMLGQFGESPQEILGHIGINTKSNTLSVLHLTRGTADCGIFREFQLKGLMEQPKLFLTRKQECSHIRLSALELKVRQNTKTWRLINE